MKPALAALACLLFAGSAAAQTTPAPAAAPFEPLHIPAPGGEVILTSEGEKRAYDAYHYAQTRRVGDMLYISGVIAGKQPDVANEAEAYRAGLRVAFKRLERMLKASGASFDDVVMINTFHVWTGPFWTGTRDEHFAVFGAVKDEFMQAPHPAWTAVGTTGLLSDQGLVEIQMIARVPGR